MLTGWVVKLGGSLLHSPYLPAWLDTLQQSAHRRIVVVPGGGVFADHVRQLQQRRCFSDEIAHVHALRAMEHYGLVLQALAGSLTVTRTVSEIEKTNAAGKAALWFPHDMVAGNPEVPASWDITSDSLALWLANRLQYRDLLIVKTEAPAGRDHSAKSLGKKGYLDRAFAGILRESPVRTWCMACDQYERLGDLMQDQGRATGIGRITP